MSRQDVPNPESEDPRLSLRSLHIPGSPSLLTHATGFIAVAAYCAAGYAFNHTTPGRAMSDFPFVYFVGFHLTFAIAPAAGILGHIAAGRPAALGWLGLGLGARDLSAAVAAFTLGCVVASFSIGAKVAAPGGFDDVTRLFANLLVASASEAVVSLGIAANLLILALRARWKNPPRYGPEALAGLFASTLFGVFHLNHAPPLDGLENLPWLAIGWLSTSAIFLLSRSLLAAILFSTTMSLVSVVRQGVELQASTEAGIALAAVTLALFVGTLRLSRPGEDRGGRA